MTVPARGSVRRSGHRMNGMAKSAPNSRRASRREMRLFMAKKILSAAMFVRHEWRPPRDLLARRKMIRTACCVDRHGRDTQRSAPELTSEGTKEKHNMYRTRNVTIALTFTLALSACSENPVGPGTTSVSTSGSGPAFAKSVTGTGLVLDNVTGLSLPLIGHIGDVTINQAVITQLGVVQDLAGNIIGVDANRVLQLTGGVLGTDVLTPDFTTDALILSSC